MSEKLNRGFDIPLGQIEEMIGAHINQDLGFGYERVIPLRAIKDVHDIVLFRPEIFKKLIRKIQLRNEKEKIYPYADAEIDIFRRQPDGFYIGQTFIHSKKILSLMQDLEGKMLSKAGFAGLSKMPPCKIYGNDFEERKAIAFYIPPIAEVYEGKGSHVALIDGIHRSFICKSAGTTINAVHINHVSSSAPLPFDPFRWERAELVNEKPPIEQRYVNLKKEYFRDLNAIGIDG